MDGYMAASFNHRHSAMQRNHLRISQTVANWHTGELLYRLSLTLITREVCRDGGFSAPGGENLYHLAKRGFKPPNKYTFAGHAS